MSIFIKNGYFCIVERGIDEIDEHLAYRGYFIVSGKPENSDEYNKLCMLSKYSSNIKFGGCVYSKNIHDMCKIGDEKIVNN